MSTKQAVFQLNGDEYGLDIRDVHTIEKDITITKRANSPNNIKGKINLRGDDIPVYSLRSKFGFEETKQDEKTRYIVITVKGMDIAFEVDHVKGIIDLEASNMLEVPPVIRSKDTSYIKSIADVDDGLLLLLDSDFLLNDEEISSLQQKEKNKHEIDK